jgi:hypothetical protein
LYRLNLAVTNHHEVRPVNGKNALTAEDVRGKDEVLGVEDSALTGDLPQVRLRSTRAGG